MTDTAPAKRKPRAPKKAATPKADATPPVQDDSSATTSAAATPPSAPTRPHLRGVSAIRAFFRRNTTPIYFVSPTPFNLLGVDRWISNFHYINYYDSFNGTHPHVFIPRERGTDDFTSMEEMNNYLLAHPELPRDLDLAALEDYLTFGMVPGRRSIFRHIEKLPPGHTLLVEPDTAAP